MPTGAVTAQVIGRTDPFMMSGTLLSILLAIQVGQPFSVESIRQWLAGWEQRAASVAKFKAMKLSDIPDQVKTETIKWLEMEADYSKEYLKRTSTSLGEFYGNYYINLTLFVVSLNDIRSISALSKTMDVAGSVSTRLAEFGEPALDPVIEQLQDQHLTGSATYTLGKFLQGKQLGKNKLSDTAEQRIHQVLIGLLRHDSYSVRWQAVEALSYAPGDQDVVRALLRVSAEDPFSIVRGSPGTNISYPIRESARKILETMGVLQ
jgi:hypothetical protein